MRYKKPTEETVNKVKKILKEEEAPILKSLFVRFYHINYNSLNRILVDLEKEGFPYVNKVKKWGKQ